MRNTAKFLVAGAFALVTAISAMSFGEASIYAQARPAQPAPAQPRRSNRGRYRPSARARIS